MSLLGKILAGLCVLAALAFVYLATVDRGKRQEWSYAVYVHDLAINGLPLEAEERDPTDGFRLVDRQGEKTQKLLDQLAGDDIPTTQHEEVERLRAQLNGEVARQDGDAARRNKLVEILAPLARTGGERDALKTAKLEELTATFDRTFADVLLPVYGPDGVPVTGKTDPEDKRHRIAHLLFNVRNDDKWHQRVLAVVGLKAYVLEGTRQADALAEMTQRVRLAMARDRAEFEKRHPQIIKEIQVQAEKLDDRKASLAATTKVKEKNEDLVNLRTKELEKLRDELDAARKATQAALADQGRYEKALFDAQRRLRDAFEVNQRYEREIRALEKVGR